MDLYKKSLRTACLVLLMLLVWAAGFSFSQDHGVTDAGDAYNILPEKDRQAVVNSWLKWRLDNILPDIMRREGIDMWLVICRENNEPPTFFSMVPRPVMYASRTTILIFHDQGPGKGVARLSGGGRGIGTFYKSILNDRNKDPFVNLAEYIAEADPKKIGVDVSENWGYGDGLTVGLYRQLVKALGPELEKRLVSAEHLSVGWLETRSPRQLSVYRHICGIAHDMIAEFFSNKVIVPDMTTTEDVVWWFRQKVTDMGLETWFQPSCSIQRSKKDAAKYPQGDRVIRRGDLLHCDVGITYLGLCTDTQQHAYVCRIGENDAPEGLKEALRKGNRLQDIFMGNFKEGRTGNEVLRMSREQAISEGLKPSIYTHPLGVHGHAAGTELGLWDRQEGVPVRGDYPLHFNTCYSIELNHTTTVPEWGDQQIRIMLEEDAAFTKEGCRFIDGRMTKFYLIK